MSEDPDALRELPFYRSLSDDGRRLLASGVAYAHCTDSQIVLRQGQQASGAYMVLAGRLRVYSISPNGNEATLYCIEPGETCVLALNCLFNDLLYPAWVEAETVTRVAVISGPVYRRLFAHEPAVRDLTIHAFSTIVFRLMEELGQVHGLNNRQRLANLLLVRASARGELRLTQQQLAQHLGTRREVVARLLSELAAAGFLSTGRGLIRLLDRDGLREIACSVRDTAPIVA